MSDAGGVRKGGRAPQSVELVLAQSLLVVVFGIADFFCLTTLEYFHGRTFPLFARKSLFAKLTWVHSHTEDLSPRNLRHTALCLLVVLAARGCSRSRSESGRSGRDERRENLVQMDRLHMVPIEVHDRNPARTVRVWHLLGLVVLLGVRRRLRVEVRKAVRVLVEVDLGLCERVEDVPRPLAAQRHHAAGVALLALPVVLLVRRLEQHLAARVVGLLLLLARLVLVLALEAVEPLQVLLVVRARQRPAILVDAAWPSVRLLALGSVAGADGTFSLLVLLLALALVKDALEPLVDDDLCLLFLYAPETRVVLQPRKAWVRHRGGRGGCVQTALKERNYEKVSI